MNKILERSVVSELSKRSFKFFVKEFWSSADTSNLIHNWHIDFLADELQKSVELVLKGEPKKEDVIINICPGTSKSMITSVMLPAWLFIKDPTIRIITGSFSSTIALELSNKSKTLIDSDKFREHFPHVKLKQGEDTKSFYKTNHGGFRFVTSSGSNIIGIHADIIIIDDPETTNSVNSEAERTRIQNWLSSKLSARKTDKLKTLTIYIQQRLHRKDATAFLLSRNTPMKHIVLPAILSDNINPPEAKEFYTDGLLDVHRLNHNALNILKADLGSYDYNAQVLQDPEDSSNTIISKDWISFIDSIESFGKPQYHYFLDTAYGGEKADYNAILECFSDSGNLYITNCYRSQEEFPQLIKSIIHFCNKSKSLYIETKASGKSILQQLKASTNFNIKTLNPTENKLIRLRSISPTVEGGRVYVLKGSWNKMLLDEVCSNYPPNDDLRDTFTYAVDTLLIRNKKHGHYAIG